jgi:hypothetical protein
MSRRPFFEKLLTVLDRKALNRLAREVCDIAEPLAHGPGEPHHLRGLEGLSEPARVAGQLRQGSVVMTDSTDKLRKRLIADACESAVDALRLGDDTEVHRVTDNQVQVRVKTSAGVKYYLVTVTAPL